MLFSVPPKSAAVRDPSVLLYVQDGDASGYMSEAHFDHVGIAVSNTDEVVKRYVDGLGAKIIFLKKKDPIWNFLWTQIEYAGLKLEFMEPVGEGFLKSFITKRGEGVHHLTFHVSDIAQVIAGLEKKGFRVVDKMMQEDYKTAFLSPKSTNGVLIQFIEKRPS